MGGLNSGRYRPRKHNTSECQEINISWLKSSGKIKFYENKYQIFKGDPAGGIEYWLEGDIVRLVYSADGERIDYWIQVSESPRYFGGSQKYFICPECAINRVKKLYRPDYSKYFACRDCHKLNYLSQQTIKKHDWFSGMPIGQLKEYRTEYKEGD